MSIDLMQKRWNLPSSKMIKGQKFCFFRKDCGKCAHFKTCTSPTGVAMDKAAYWGYCHGIREETTEAMRAGTERHRIYQEGISTVDELGGPAGIQERLLDGEYLEIQEVPVCSRYWGLHGFIDILEIQLKGDQLFAKIIDLKTGWMKKYLYQISAYGMILEDPDFHVCYDQRYKNKAGVRRLGERIIPRGMTLNKNIKLCIYFFGSKNTLDFEWMSNNTLSDFAAGMTAQVSRRLKEYRPLHKQAFILPEDVHPQRKDKQRFFGTSKLLKKTKPKIYHEPVYKI